MVFRLGAHGSVAIGKISIYQFRLDIETGERGLHALHGDKVPFVGQLEEESAAPGVVHPVPAPADDADGELGTVAQAEGPLVGEPRRAAAQREQGDLESISRTRNVILRKSQRLGKGAERRKEQSQKQEAP